MHWKQAQPCPLDLRRRSTANLPTPYVQPFARFIVGETHSGGVVSLMGVTGSSSVNSFFIAPGTGADFRITRNVWLRGGADYLRTSKDGVTVNGVRAFGGITFMFGGKGRVRDQTTPTTRDSTPAPRPAPHETGGGIKIDALGVMAKMGANTGAEISDVVPNGVAALAGLHVGDVTNAVDSAPVKTPMELAAELANRPAGAKVRLGYLIHGAWQTETVVLLAR
jgi:hypothetical protein